MKKALFLFALLLFGLVSLRAENQKLTVEATATGPTREQAIANALAEAVRQGTGTRLDSQRDIAATLAQVSVTTNGQGNRTVNIQEQTQEKLRLLTQGTIASYRILQENKQEDGTWEVHVSADILKYVTPELSPDSRRKIAMIPFATRDPHFLVGNTKMAASTVSDDILSDFNMHFTQSRRFAVLTRQDNAALKAEKNLLAAEGSVVEMAKLGQTLGLDYMVLGTVKQLYIAAPQTRTIAVSGNAYTTIDRAFLELDYRIVVPATSQIKWTDHIIIDLAPQEIAQSGGDMLRLYQTLVQYAGVRIAEAMDNIYPIKVLQLLVNGEFVLDRGGSLMVPGAYYDVFRLGEEITNPSNGESLGRTEEKIATVQITRVDAKLSYAGLVPNSGTLTKADIENGVYLRPFRMTAIQGAQPPAPQPPPKPFKLPFDK
ncbi:MAG: hypothetical protein IJJ26_04455 [Victivallales bacterium]|nr:hypothetical protein [Victivallales bacterium]